MAAMWFCLLTIVVFAKEGWTAPSAGKTDRSIQLCPSQSPHVDYKSATASTNVDCSKALIFMDQLFTCEGEVTSWQFVAKNTGTFCAAIWRPNYHGDEHSLRLVGMNCITVDDMSLNTLQEYDVPSKDTIEVQTSDVVGIFCHGAQTETVVKVLDSSSLNVTTSKLRTMLSYDRKGELKLEHHYDMNKGVHSTGALALRAIVSGTSAILRLNPAACNVTNGGRAELFIAGSWGTICDNWYHQLGWPMLFCNQLGFPDPYFAFYNTHNIEDTMAINQQSPRCKSSTTGDQSACYQHPNGMCGHDKDLCVICMSRYSLKYGPVADSEGLAFFFKSHWGFICETEEFEAKRKQEGNRIVWQDLFCKHQGFTSAASYVRVKDKDLPSTTLNMMSSHVPTLSNPSCEFDDIEKCKSEGSCEVEDAFYIICETVRY